MDRRAFLRGLLATSAIVAASFVPASTEIEEFIPYSFDTDTYISAKNFRIVTAIDIVENGWTIRGRA
jgi:hypothetical protein